MKLYQSVRDPNCFNQQVLNIRLFDTGIRSYPASVLFRIIGLTALTFRENANNVNNVVTLNEYQKVCPIDDCLFLFGNNNQHFSYDAQDNHAIIASNELIIGQTSAVGNFLFDNRKTVNNFKNFVRNNRNGNLWPANLMDWNLSFLRGEMDALFETLNNVRTVYNNTTGQGATRNVANAAAQAILNTGNNININNLPNVIVNNANFITFFDEVNIIHNVHKSTARAYVVGPYLFPFYRLENLKINFSSLVLDPLMCMTIHRSGNFESDMKVEGLGNTYNNIGKNNLDLLSNFKSYFTTGQLNNQPEYLLKIMRNLYRLECIREPAALITNALFFELASIPNGVGYRAINNALYAFNTMDTYMPMGREGAVPGCRNFRDILMSKIDEIRNEEPAPAILPPYIYYNYDYASQPNLIPLIPKIENNLLFNYVMYKSGLTGVIRNILEMQSLISQRNYLRDVINEWDEGVVPIITIGNSIFTKEVVVDGNAYRFRVDTSLLLNDRATVTNVIITSFPLIIIDQVMRDWYGVDLDLPNINIETELKLLTL
jgi:hypothetical protein